MLDETAVTSESQSHELENTTDKKPSKILALGIGVAFLLVIIGVVGTTVYGVYQGSENKVLVTMAQVLHVPVARVNGSPIYYHDYVRDLHSLRTFYAKKGGDGTAYTKEQESDQVLSRLIANTMIKNMAKKFDVMVTTADRDAAKKDILLRFDNDEQKLAKDLERE
jgi:stringent starvation protein B